MDNLKKFSLCAGAVCMLGVFPACNGLFGGLYDEAEEGETSEYGFITVDTSDNSGTIYIDVSSYTRWVYIDMHNFVTDTLGVEDEAPDSWDFAVHRYDAKTNGGSVLETDYTDLESLRAAGIPSGTYVADSLSTSQIIIDMSGMMSGVIGYLESDYNGELSKWLNTDLSTMPPIYTLSGKAYVLKMQDNTHAALLLSNYMNESGTKGYLTINYIYPL